MTTPTDKQLEKLQKLFEREDLTYFEQGDLLLAIDPDDDALAKLGERFMRSTATLRERIKVSRMFPPERRSTQNSWSIYREASRIKKNEDRFALLDTRPEWTLGAIDTAVQDYLEKQADAQRGRTTPKKGARAGFKADSVQGAVSLEDGVLMIELRGGIISEGRVVEISEGRSQVIFKVRG